MPSSQNKRGSISDFLVNIIYVTAGFIIIFAIINIFHGKADAKSTEAICRGSVALRERTYTEISPFGVKVDSVASPLLCKTIDKYLPEDKDASKEQIEEELANNLASCWKMFGEGLVEDVFKEGDRFKKNCFTCYSINLRETSNFKDEIKSTDFLKYLFDTPYMVSPSNDNCRIGGGFCIDSDSTSSCSSVLQIDKSYFQIDRKNGACASKGKSSCCYTDYSCWNNGGTCSANNPDESSYSLYSGWKCPSKQKCFVKKENYYSYGQYIQKFGGPGNIVLLTDIKPGESYAVSFGSKTKECSWCTSIGIGTGLGLAITPVWYALAVSTGPVGWTALGAQVVIGGTLGYVAAKSGSEAVAKNIDEFFNERKTNTIYLTTVNQIQKGNLCSLIPE